MKLSASLPVVTYLSISALVVYGLYSAMQPRTISFFIDTQFAPQVVQQCQTLVTPQFLHEHSFGQAIQSVQHAVAGCEQCSIRQCGFQKAHVTVKGYAPFARINQNLVVTQQGTLIPAATMQEVILERLPAIKVIDPTIAQPDTVKNLFAFLRALPAALWENHAIIWANKTAIYLIDKATPDIAILAMHTTRFTPELLQAITALQEKITEAMKKKGHISQKKIIDVRVKGQIIIKHMQGGDYENTSGEKYYNGN